MNQEEYHIQKALFEWRDTMLGRYPKLKYLKGDMGGVRLPIGLARKMKAAGCMIRGWSDIQLPIARHGYNGLFIELKTEEGRLTKEQKTFLSDLTGEGYYAGCCKGLDAAIRSVENYVKGKP